MADIKNKQTMKTKKKHGNDFVSRIEELKSQLSLKQDILERSDKVEIYFSGWEYTSVPGVRVAHYLKTKIVLSYYVSLHSEYRVLMSATISA
jgi:hypothetical protein